jgi:hypothetical protein
MKRGAFFMFGDDGAHLPSIKNAFKKRHEGAAGNSENGVDAFLFQIRQKNLNRGKIRRRLFDERLFEGSVKNGRGGLGPFRPECPEEWQRGLELQSPMSR